MKKNKFLIFMLIIIFSAVLVSEESVYYARSVPIAKIYPHRLGYGIAYMKSNLTVAMVYVPAEWFMKAGGKAEIVYGLDPSYPYFTVFWKNGKFDHIRIFVRENPDDITWGRFNPDVDPKAVFGNIEEIKIEF